MIADESVFIADGAKVLGEDNSNLWENMLWKTY